MYNPSPKQSSTMQPENNFISLVEAIYFLPWHNSRSGPRPPHYRRFMIKLSKTPHDEWSARCRDLYLTTHKPSKREAANLGLRPRGHWDLQKPFIEFKIYHRLCSSMEWINTFRPALVRWRVFVCLYAVHMIQAVFCCEWIRLTEIMPLTSPANCKYLWEHVII
jgi:hypothetical protein